MRRLAALALVPLLVLALAACTPEEDHTWKAINAFRARHGLP